MKIKGKAQQNGALIIVVLGILLSLSMLAIYTLEYAHTGFNRAVDFKLRVQATYMAEAGLEIGLSELMKTESLGTLELPYTLLPVTYMGAGSFKAELLNNPDDSETTHDSDGTFIVRATGWSQGMGRRRVLETYVCKMDVAAVPGALTVGAGTTYRTTRSVSISGFDIADPSLESAVAGVAFEHRSQIFRMRSRADVTGNPPYSWASTAFRRGEGFSAALAETVNVIASDPDAVHLNGNLKGPLGTPDAPQITVIDAGTTAKGTYLIGAGILIIRGEFKAMGSMEFEGVIVVDGPVSKMQASNLVVKGAVVLLDVSTGDDEDGIADDDDGEEDDGNGHENGDDDDDDGGCGNDHCGGHGGDCGGDHGGGDHGDDDDDDDDGKGNGSGEEKKDGDRLALELTGNSVISYASRNVAPYLVDSDAGLSQLEIRAHTYL